MEHFERNGSDEFKVVLDEFLKTPIDYDRIKIQIKAWSCKSNRKFLKQLRRKGVTSSQLKKLLVKVVDATVDSKNITEWNRATQLVEFVADKFTKRQTLHDLTLRLINLHKSIISSESQGESAIPYIIDFIGMLYVLLIIFVYEDLSRRSLDVLNNYFKPLSEYLVLANFPRMKAPAPISTSDCFYNHDYICNSVDCNVASGELIKYSRLGDDEWVSYWKSVVGCCCKKNIFS